VLPYHDEIESQRAAVITIGLIGVNALVWIVWQSAGIQPALSDSLCRLGLIPAEVTGYTGPGAAVPIGASAACLRSARWPGLSLLTWMFAHSSWAHLIGNMWFLWLFGNTLEDSMTRARFLIFYLICGVTAAATQIIASPASIAPLVGASGAISGVMGAYFVMFPRVRMFTVVPFGFTMRSVALPVWTIFAYWIAIQIVTAALSRGRVDTGGVAVWAHVGGLIGGVTTVWAFRRRHALSGRREQRWHPRQIGWR
jgi:membrane associated rhomboid family serine protease